MFTMDDYENAVAEELKELMEKGEGKAMGAMMAGMLAMAFASGVRIRLNKLAEEKEGAQ